MRVLWISPRWPFPAIDGAKLATWSLLKSLAQTARLEGSDFELDLVCFYDESPTKQQIDSLTEVAKIDRLLLLQKPAALRARALDYLYRKPKTFFGSRIPYTVLPFATSGHAKEFLSWAENRSWDFTVGDGLHAFGLQPLLKARNGEKPFGRLIYRAHNVESDLWKQNWQNEAHFIKKKVFGHEYRFFMNFEKRIVDRVAQVITVSERDGLRFRELYHCRLPRAVVIGVDGPATPLLQTPAQNSLKLLFVGRLDWIPNRDGLIWFLDEVWPHTQKAAKERGQSVTLTIVGSGDHTWLEKKELPPGVEVLGRVRDLVPHYQNSDLTLIPLFMGSGTRVKAIEAAIFGRSFLTTQLGVEGLPFRKNVDYFEAETAQEWIQILTSLNQPEAVRRGQSAWQTARLEFDPSRLAALFLSILNPRAE